MSKACLLIVSTGFVYAQAALNAGREKNKYISSILLSSGTFPHPNPQSVYKPYLKLTDEFAGFTDFPIRS